MKFQIRRYFAAELSLRNLKILQLHCRAHFVNLSTVSVEETVVKIVDGWLTSRSTSHEFPKEQSENSGVGLKRHNEKMWKNKVRVNWHTCNKRVAKYRYQPTDNGMTTKVTQKIGLYHLIRVWQTSQNKFVSPGTRVPAKSRVVGLKCQRKL